MRSLGDFKVFLMRRVDWHYSENWQTIVVAKDRMQAIELTKKKMGDAKWEVVKIINTHQPSLVANWTT